MDDSHHQPAEFLTTQWSLVLRAGAVDQQQANAALAALCERYWYPLYAYVRRRTSNVEDARDVIQGFFARLLEKNVLAGITRSGGKFRAFLLVAVKNYLANERDRAAAEKRGGSQTLLSLDFARYESKIALEPTHDVTPERLFQRQWAITLLEVVMQRLEAEQAAAGKSSQFASLKAALTGSGERLPYGDIATELGISEEAARQAGSRLRKRYRELLRDEVGSTVARPEEIDEEIRELFLTLG